MSTFPPRTTSEASNSLTLAFSGLRRKPLVAIRSAWPAVIMLTLSLASAQRDTGAGAGPSGGAGGTSLSSLPFTFKAGEFRVLATPSVGLDWNDNIFLSKDNRHDDFILKPLLTLKATYPVTQKNLLQLNIGVGYEKYFLHDELSTWFLQSGSEVSFDIMVKDLQINLHDRFTYSQDSASEAQVANTGEYANINNTVGLLATWNLQDVILSAGYDHGNIFSPSAEFDSQARSTEAFLARAGLRIHPELTAGVEGGASFTTYDEKILNDNTSYNAGVYADWRVSPHFRIQPRAGYSIFQFQNTSQSGVTVPGIFTNGPAVQTKNLNSWYAGLTLSHQVTEALSYSLSAGHDVQPGIQSDAAEIWYVRSSFDWKIVKNMAFQTQFTYQHGETGIGNIQGNLKETYDSLGGGFNLSRAIMKKVTLALNYRLTVRYSDIPIREYIQNLVSLQLTYRPQ
jgi:hypothetical protein